MADQQILLDQGGFIGGFDPESLVTFTNGEAILPQPPDVVFQVVTAGSQFVWRNVYSGVIEGTGSMVEVEYYIDSAKSKVYGTQKGGSFGQPREPNSTEPMGKIKLKQPLSGDFYVNFCVTVPDVIVEYGEGYEAWPMWRKLATNEFASAGDAIHWFNDAFKKLRTVNPDNPLWARAHDRTLDTWRQACDHESDTTLVFKRDAKGQYNSFPLTYSYAFGRTRANDPNSNWNAEAPSSKYSIVRNPATGNVDVMLPEENGEYDSEDPVRYGFVFENKPLYINLTSESQVQADISASIPAVMYATMELADGKSFTGSIMMDPEHQRVSVPVSAFKFFQNEPGDSTGDQTGDWSGEEPWEPPVYPAVPFPGRRLGMIGDSITYQNVMQYAGIESGYYAYFAFTASGWLNYAQAFTNYRLEIEPGLQPSEAPDPELDGGAGAAGYNWGVAGSRTTDWEKETFYPLGPAFGPKVGPMYQYRRYKDKVDLLTILGGANDFAGNRPVEEVFSTVRRFAYEIAADGKWVFWCTITPRTTRSLSGYTLEQQAVIRNRILEYNQRVRDLFAELQPKNMFLVDWWDRVVGPNGIDPHGWVSNSVDPEGGDSFGNWRSDDPQFVGMADGLHPNFISAFGMGEVLGQAIIDAGVPPRNGYDRGPLVAGPNLAPNPTFNVSTTFPSGGMSSTLGRSIGLGPSLTDSSHQRPAGVSERNNLGLGYQYGQVPDLWKIYRSSNSDQESFSNFGEYTWSALAGNYPELLAYMNDSTWADGCLKTSIVTVGGRRGFKIEFSTPQTGNKQEAFRLNCTLPSGLNGPWNNYGFSTWPKTENPVNNIYQPGDKIGAEMELHLSNIKNLHTMRLSTNFLAVDNDAIAAGDITTSGALISGLGMPQTFWPPSLIDLVRHHDKDRVMHVATPIVVAPTPPRAGLYPYLTFNLEVAVDASQGPGSVTVIVFDPRVHKYAGGPL